MSAQGLFPHAAASVQFIAGAPSFLWQSGEFQAAIVDNGVGDVTLQFQAANGIDATECSFLVTPRNNAARINISVEQVDDTDKRVRIFDEAAAGLADINFDLFVLRRVIV